MPVRQWVISVPKRLGGILADRPAAVAALTRIFLGEIERFLLTASGVNRNAASAFLPARPITPADLAALTERVRSEGRSLRSRAALARETVAEGTLTGLSFLARPPRAVAGLGVTGWLR